jgi:2-polyprenyl-3-methyl-5-hydroxy-6-metoxy-1,4-benzoquinol methylase
MLPVDRFGPLFQGRRTPLTQPGSFSFAPALAADRRGQRLWRLIEPDVRELRPHSVLCCGQSLDTAAQCLAAELSTPVQTDVASASEAALAGRTADLVICSGLLERTPVADLDALLQRLQRVSDRAIFQIATCANPPGAHDAVANCTVRYGDWWLPKLRQVFAHVEPVETSANDVVFKTWRSSRLQLPLRAWRRVRANAALRRDAAVANERTADGVERPPSPQCLSCEAPTPDYLGDKNGYHVWKCERCSLVFVDPMPSGAEIDEFYSQHPRNDKYLKKSDGKYRRARWRIMRLKRRVRGRRFLDIGCSIGSSVAAAHAAGFEATGIDLDGQSIEFAAKHYPQCRFLQTSSADLARAGEKFDLIFCTEVIEHVADPQAFVDDLRALLNPGGVLFLTTPHATHFRIPTDILSWYGLKPPEHIVLFGRKSITALFERRGLQVLSVPLRLKTTLKVVARRAVKVEVRATSEAREIHSHGGDLQEDGRYEWHAAHQAPNHQAAGNVAETIRRCPMCGHDNRTTSASQYSREHWRIKTCTACQFVYLENAASYDELVSDFAWSKTKVNERDRKISREPMLLKAERKLRKIRRRTFGYNDKALIFLKAYVPRGEFLDIGCGMGGNIERAPNLRGSGIELDAMQPPSQELPGRSADR